MIHKGRRERVRQRFINEGLSNFEDHEILELLLFYSIPYKDTNEIAHELLNKYKSLSAILESDIRTLTNICGIGENSAILIKMILQIYERYKLSKLQKNLTLNKTKDALKYCSSKLQHMQKEHFLIVTLNNNYEIISDTIISNGNAKSINVNFRSIVEKVLFDKASYVIISHNHIGDSCEPSIYDIDTTNKLRSLLENLEIELLDHIIVTYNTSYSLKTKEKIYNIEEA